jgi:hypothetical protein
VEKNEVMNSRIVFLWLYKTQNICVIAMKLLTDERGAGGDRVNDCLRLLYDDMLAMQRFLVQELEKAIGKEAPTQQQKNTTRPCQTATVSRSTNCSRKPSDKASR